ncbi:DEAD/DEAH box helicase [Streptomyces sp. NPDC005017]|uniref:DEAD/DEAH box helicase n=1 Tax=Streptomyces sp. NPDC005017 TaxID=3364706 RepID=UPI0036B0E317
MPEGQTVSAASRRVAELVRAFSSGISERELVVEAKRQFGALPEQRLVKLVAEAVRGGLLIASGDLLLPVAPQELVRPAQVASERRQPSVESAVAARLDETSVLRTVALDVESVVRTTATAPYLERHVYEAAAVRFGADREWVAAAPRWRRYLRFPGDTEELRDGSVRDAVLGQGVSQQQAWTELRDFLSDADVVVAYNGTTLDFPVVCEAAKEAGTSDPLSAVRPVDALYLAHAMWPTAPSHRLQDLAIQLDVSRSGLRAHTADSDVLLLVRLLERAAAEFACRTAELRGLIADVCPDSDAWRLLRELAEGEDANDREPQVWEHAHVTRLLGAEFGQHTPRRTPGGRAPGKGAVDVPDVLRGADGRVEPTALARVVHGARVEPRPAQQEMTATLHDWTDRDVGGLLEAPTGTGKSYAVLAAALDWLAGGDSRTAVIATYTKQLQSQMAKDVQDLERALPGILGVADLVKGKSNRLSLAALTKTLAEATRRRRSAGTARARFSQRIRFRELAVFLALRLLAAKEPPPVLDGQIGRPGGPARLLHRLHRARPAALAGVAVPARR